MQEKAKNILPGEAV